jgi:hypothetical protein
MHNSDNSSPLPPVGLQSGGLQKEIIVMLCAALLSNIQSIERVDRMHSIWYHSHRKTIKSRLGSGCVGGRDSNKIVTKHNTHFTGDQGLCQRVSGPGYKKCKVGTTRSSPLFPAQVGVYE